MNFPLRTAFVVSHKFWVVMSSFSFVFRNFLILSLISFVAHSLFHSMLLNIHEFDYFGVFSMRLVSNISPLWSEKMFDMISIFLNLLSLFLCPIIWCIFENFPCEFEKNVYFAFWDERLYIYQLSSFDLGHCSMSQYLC